MTDDVFDQDQQIESEGSVLEQLVGEGKKYKTVEDLAKSRIKADEYIEQLENENKLTREQMAELESNKDKQATIADLIETVKKANKQDPDSANHVTDEELSKKIKSIIDGEKEASTKESNRLRANKAVLDKMNGNVEAAKSYVAERAKALGMTVKELQALGERSPEAFQELMDVKSSTVSQSVSSLPGQRNVSGNSVEVIDGHRTKAYYTKLKKELGPSKYWNDPKIQGQYTKDALALGDRFNQ